MYGEPSPCQRPLPGPQGAALPPCEGEGRARLASRSLSSLHHRHPCTSQAFNPPFPPQGRLLPTHPPSPPRESTSLQNGRGRSAREGGRESASAVPGADGASRPRAGTKEKATRSRALSGSGSGLQSAPSPGPRGLPRLQEPPRGARVPGAPARSARTGGVGCAAVPGARARRAPPRPPARRPPARARPRTHRAEAAGGGGAPGARALLQAPCPLSASASRPPSSARCPGPSRPGSRRGASPAAAAAAPPLRRGRRASLPQAVAGGGTGCISPGYIAAPGRRGGVGNAEPAGLPAPDVRGGRRGREGGDRGGPGAGGRCASGASHPLTFTSPAASRALLPQLFTLISPCGGGPGPAAPAPAPSRSTTPPPPRLSKPARCRSAREEAGRGRAIM